MNIFHLKWFRIGLFSAVASLLSLGWAVTGAAQDGGAVDQLSLEEITVTGTRIRSDDFSSAQPATVVGGELMDDLGIVNLGDMMNTLPSNVGNNTPTANPGGNFFNGSNLANLRGLNPFFGSRTLTLVDSRRHVPTNQGDGVDLNFIPNILVDRMEVVTGGASASYGSGAIGGVTNILLNRDLEGAKAQIDWGQTQEGDGDNFHYGFAWGTSVGENGNFVIAVEGQDMDGITECYKARDWCARAATVQTNNGYQTNDMPRYLLVSDTRNDSRSAEGVGLFPFLDLVFTDASGTTLRSWNSAGPMNQGGEGRHQYRFTNLRSPVERQVVYASYTHQFSDDMSVFIEGSVGNADTFTPQGGSDITGTLAQDNYYLNRLPGGNPCTGLPGFLCNYARGVAADAPTSNLTTTDLQRWVVGISGRFGDSSWTWDAYYQSGESDRNQIVENVRHIRRFQMGLDAVPSIPGDYSSAPICRVTRDGIAPGIGTLFDARLAEGCQPINPFGIGNMSPEGFDYGFGRLHENTVVEQEMVEFVTSGEVFGGFGAGPVRGAVGVSWRDESIANIRDPSQPDYIARDYTIQYGESFGGSVNVLEYFVETTIPFSEAIDVQVAARQSSYENTAGLGTPNPGDTFDYDITTWKVSGSWQALDWLRLRGSQSRDSRAPNFRELYYGQDLQRGGAFGYCSNEWTGNLNLGWFTNTGDPCTIALRGGLDLKAEVSDTTTLGVVLTPSRWNVRLALDYFNIEIEDAITPASSSRTLDGCVDGIAYFCSQISGTPIDPNDLTKGFSVIDTITPTAFNFRQYTANGFDISMDWVGEFDFGTLSTRLVASRMLEQLIQPVATNASLIRNIANTVGATNGFLADWSAAPGWRTQWINSYRNGPLTLTTSMNWIKEGQIWANRIGPEDDGYSDKNPNSVWSNRIGNYVIWTLAGSYAFAISGVEMEAFASINNLFDKQPPVTGTGVGGAAGFFYDTIGRRAQFGLRAEF